MINPSKESWKKTWKNAYSISLASKSKYTKRLNELESWDKPFREKLEGDPESLWLEHEAKVEALKELISN